MLPTHDCDDDKSRVDRLARFVVGSHVRSHKSMLNPVDPASQSEMSQSQAQSQQQQQRQLSGAAASPGTAMALMDAQSGSAAAGDSNGAVMAAPPTPGRSRGIVNDKAEETISQDLLKKYLSYARSNVRPQLGQIDENKLVTLYQELRRDSITAGGVPIAVRHIESIVRISEANARMRE